MSAIPKKVVDRFTSTIKKFQTILQTAKDRDINEADTVAIINDMLSEIFGYDKYFDVTSEFAIKGQYCDLAIKINGTVQYLIEVKAIGMDLKENHLKQVVLYGAQQGTQWVILTNGIIWEIYKIKFEKPLDQELVCMLNMLDINPKKEDDHEKLYLLCKEGINKSAREEFFERIQNVNRFVIANIILTEPVLNAIKKELKNFVQGLKIENEEIEKLITNEVLKRETLEGDNADKAKNKIKKYLQKKLKPNAPVVNENPKDLKSGYDYEEEI